ncbi:hypothetical protein ABC795_04570 [Blastococcus sp. HT6-30]|uniref:hypothetical protein n=1 Tax=Blastococcus sp. HT6-30 TaxID=3144843 RepID=UPI00321AC1E2
MSQHDQHDLSRRSSRLTHQQRLARAIKEINGSGLQRALQLVTDAANAGKLAGPLDSDGMLRAVNTLLGHDCDSTSAGPSMPAQLRRSPAVPSTDSPQPVEPTIEWSCELCETVVTGEDGGLRMPSAELSRYKRELDAFEEARERRWAQEEHGLRFYSPNDLPSRAHWLVICHSCHGKHQRWQEGLDDYTNRYDGYNIQVGRIDTPIKLLRWTSHLMTKDWLASTDWHRLLAAKTGGDDLRL